MIQAGLSLSKREVVTVQWALICAQRPRSEAGGIIRYMRTSLPPAFCIWMLAIPRGHIELSSYRHPL